MERQLSPTVENALYELARMTDDLYHEESEKIIGKSGAKKRPKRTYRTVEDKLFKLINQLPEGSWVKPKEVIDFIIRTRKKNQKSSITYSPLIVNYKEFNSCKVMKYGSGNIITGRDRELNELMLTLCKKDKRGCIMVGEPGVGKTAIVQALNARLIERTVPRQLIGCQLLNMDLPYIFTKHKDDPLGIIIKILERASVYDKAILFIDEVHQLLGHKMNDVLKPYLTEKIRYIGSTTINEYHSIITDDTALERRFTLVHIDQPNIENTVGMVT